MDPIDLARRSSGEHAPDGPLPAMTEAERDCACIERMCAGETRALEELYDRYSGLLYSLVVRVTGSATDAEDVLQEVWVQVWKKAPSYDATRGNTAAWLVTIARSRAIDRVRSRGSRLRAETVSGAEPMPMVPDASAAAVRSQLQETVGGALAQLDAKHRQVLELAFFEGLSHSEIAARIAAPLGTVKSWTRQALQRLRDRVPEELRS